MGQNGPKWRFFGLCQVERVMGIEPTLPAWKAGALPLSYTRKTNRRGLPLRCPVPGKMER